jgi:hypothetical protein
VQNRIARPEKGKERRRNRRHAAGEDGGTLGLIPDRQPILKDFEVGVVEARIDQARFLARARLTTAGGKVEEILALLGILENDGRCEEDRRLERALRKARRIAVAHHQRAVDWQCGPCSSCPPPRHLLLALLVCDGRLL